MAYQYNDQYAYQAYQQAPTTMAGYAISPQQLMNTNNVNNYPMASSSSAIGEYIAYGAPYSPHIPSQFHEELPRTRSEGVKLHELGALEPGKEHQLSQDPKPTPRSIMDGSYDAALKNLATRDIVIIVPRPEAHVGKPTLPTIVFSVNGRPGPYLSEILKKSVTLDDAYDAVFSEMAWKQTSLTIDWPGVTSDAGYIPCMDKTHEFTRAEIALTVAARVASLLLAGGKNKLKWGPQELNKTTKPWDLHKINYRKVRLLGINYYRKTWVPVLAMDARTDD